MSFLRLILLSTLHIGSSSGLVHGAARQDRGALLQQKGRADSGEVEGCSRLNGRKLRQLPPNESMPIAPCNVQCQLQEREALMLLYSSLNGSSWSQAGGWAGPAHHCTWRGVFCCPSGPGGSNSYSLLGSGLRAHGVAAAQSRLHLTCMPSTLLNASDEPSVVALSLISSGLRGPVSNAGIEALLNRTLQALELPSNALTGPLPTAWSSSLR
jgi:hypothetical protein